MRLLFVDGRHHLSAVRGLCRLIQHTGVEVPVILVVTEGGLAAVAADWGVDDVVLLDSAGPAEIDARIRLACGQIALERRAASQPERRGWWRAHGRRAVVRRPSRRPRPPPHVQGVRAGQVPCPAPRPRVQPAAAARRGVGAGLLRRHPHGRCPCTAAAGQARSRARAAHRHGAQRGIPVRTPDTATSGACGRIQGARARAGGARGAIHRFRARASGGRAPDDTTASTLRRARTPPVSERRTLTDVEASQLAALVEAAVAADGVNPLDDQVRSELAFGAASDCRHLLGRRSDDDQVIAYAHCRRTATRVSGASRRPPRAPSTGHGGRGARA